jgi:hypothetical protein
MQMWLGIKLYHYYKHKLGVEQNGFRRECACSDNFFYVKISIESTENLMFKLIWPTCGNA